MKKHVALFFIYLAVLNLMFISSGIHVNTVKETIGHFRHHRVEDEKMSVSSFLLLHYCPFSKHEKKAPVHQALLVNQLPSYIFSMATFVFHVTINQITANYCDMKTTYLFMYYFEFFIPPK